MSQGLSTESLIHPGFNFRFEIPLQWQDNAWGKAGWTSSETHSLPHLARMDGAPSVAEVRAGWNEDSLAVEVVVTGKRQSLWCRDSRIDDSDGLHFWIDTRCTPDIHRASQYCHRFAFLPAGAGTARKDPSVVWVPIHRARSQPKTIDTTKIRRHATIRHDGYRMSVLIPRSQLTGYEPENQNRISLFYCVTDSELGAQWMTLDETYPVEEDPSMWVQAKLDPQRS